LITVPRWMRFVLAVLSVIDLMIFSRLTILPLIGMLIGAAVILLGLEYQYRPASFIGLLVVAIASSASINIPSLLTIGNVLTAMIGLFLPLVILIWLALSSEEGDTQHVSVVRSAATTSLGYALVCIWVAPIAALIISLFLPTVAMRMSTFAEICMMLVATIAGGVLILRRRPRIATPEEQEKSQKA
jgi:hypothetical protein